MREIFGTFLLGALGPLRRDHLPGNHTAAPPRGPQAGAGPAARAEPPRGRGRVPPGCSQRRQSCEFLNQGSFGWVGGWVGGSRIDIMFSKRRVQGRQPVRGGSFITTARILFESQHLLHLVAYNLGLSDSWRHPWCRSSSFLQSTKEWPQHLYCI